MKVERITFNSQPIPQGDNFSASTRISPFENITLNLDWDATISQKSTKQLPLHRPTKLPPSEQNQAHLVRRFGPLVVDIKIYLKANLKPQSRILGPVNAPLSIP